MTIQVGLIKFLSVVGVLVAAASSNASLVTIDFEGVAPAGGTLNANGQNFTFGDYNVYVAQGTFIDAAAPQVTNGTWANDGTDYLNGTGAQGFTISRTDGGLFNAFSFSASEFLASTSRPQQFRAIGITTSGLALQTFTTNGTFGFETFTFSSDFVNLYSLQIFDNQALIAWDNVQVSAVPEPASLALFGLGGVGLALAARRRRKQVSDN